MSNIPNVFLVKGHLPGWANFFWMLRCTSRFG